MSGSHTPGPWALHQYGGFCRVVEDSGYQYRVKHSSAWQTGAWCMDDATDESRANDRLIAAAPELYEALAEAVSCGLVPISTAKEGGASAYSSQIRCADKIRAALAKARGET